MTTDRPVAALACLACRQRHLRCDGSKPFCRRCTTSNVECLYAASRRGRRPQKLVGTRSNQSTPHAVPENAGNLIQDFIDGASLQSFSGSSIEDVQQSVEVVQPCSPDHIALKEDVLLRVYYQSFHLAHPFVLPRKYAESHGLPALLVRAMHFVASHYADSSYEQPGSEGSVLNSLRTCEPDSPFAVQVALLLTIALHSRNKQASALDTLADARAMALRLRMNDDPSITALAKDDLWLVESFRRTWWELVFVDAILSALHKQTQVKSAMVQISTRLPCEDSLYESGQTAAMANFSIEELHDRHFMETPIAISSAALRVEAVFILSKALGIDAYNEQYTETRLNEVDSLLSSWTHNIPTSKHEILIDRCGSVDEALFQAHMIVETATIMLHLPRSDLHSARASQHDVECALKAPAQPSFASRHVHSVATIRAAERLSKLASLPTNSVIRRTPFWICSLVLSTTAHLSACCIDTGFCIASHRQSVIQALGLLTSLGAVWPIAWHAMRQLRAVASDVMLSGRKPTAKQRTEPDDARLLQDSAWNADLEGFFSNIDFVGTGVDQDSVGGDMIMDSLLAADASNGESLSS